MTFNEITTRLGLKDQVIFMTELDQKYLANIKACRDATNGQKVAIINEIVDGRQTGKTTKILVSVIKNLLAAKTSAVYVASFGQQKVTYNKLAAMLRSFPEIELDICHPYEIVVRTYDGTGQCHAKLAVKIVVTQMELIGTRFDDIFYDDCKEQK